MASVNDTDPIIKKKKTISIIFGNILDIHNVNKELLHQLNERLGPIQDLLMTLSRSSSPSDSDTNSISNEPRKNNGLRRQRAVIRKTTLMHKISRLRSQLSSNTGLSQKEMDDLNTWKISDIFLALIPFLKIYSFYAQNFNMALDILNREMKHNDTFKKFVEVS